MTDAEKLTEGWQGEKSWSTPRAKYHYIRNTEALCHGLMFYTGELVPGGLTHSESREDCAPCKRKVDAELAKLTEHANGSTDDA